MTDLPEVPNYTAGTWIVDNVHSYVGFTIRHMMVSKVRGRFTAFTAEFTTRDNPLETSVSATIDATSIDTGNSMRDDHIRSADFFAAADHPTITFTSTGIRFEDGEFLLDGSLTIRGNSRPVTLTLDSPAFGPDAQGGMKAGFSASTEINRHDFGVSYNGPVPGGGVIVSEKVAITLEIEGVLDKGE
ncbi:MAG TPA: YceI family protein [Actinospica sp.]|nr:YceI family protein [Actinospica sp.]